jgi:hypothetical protein
VAAHLVFQAHLMLGTLGDALLTPALDTGKIGLRKICEPPRPSYRSTWARIRCRPARGSSQRR